MGVLEVTQEKERDNKFISSILFSRGSIFYPSDKYTKEMQKKLQDRVNSKGQVRINEPLERYEMTAFNGDRYLIDLHVDYLLQPHRDLLDTILAFGNITRLSESALFNKDVTSWEAVIRESIPNATATNGHLVEDELPSRSVVFNISLYNLCKELNVQYTPKNVERILSRIMQLTTTTLAFHRLDDDGEIAHSMPMRLLSDYRFCHDPNKKKINAKADKTLNHIFILPSPQLLHLISSSGYYRRLEQRKMSHYRSQALRSFIKYLLTHKESFLENKKLSWLIARFESTVPIARSRNFTAKLKEAVLKEQAHLERDFHYRFIPIDQGDYKLISVKELLHD